MGELRLGEDLGVHDRLLGTTLAGRYRLDALLGRGGMGRVYRARDERLERDVALKVLAEDVSHDPGIAERFVREAKVLARLQHKHVLQVFDHGETEEGRLFLVTELLRGQSMSDVLRAQEGRRLSPRATAQLLVQIATGLDRVHADGVIHRDLKPANIFVESDDGRPHVKILDFGIARRLASGGSTNSGLIGTPAYMSPEQVRAEREIDARTDLTSLSSAGSAVQIACAPPSTPTGITCTGDEQVGIAFTIPTPGVYRVCVATNQSLSTNSGGRISTTWRLIETSANSSTPIVGTFTTKTTNRLFSDSRVEHEDPVSICETVSWSTAGQKLVRLAYWGNTNGTVVSNVASTYPNVNWAVERLP